MKRVVIVLVFAIAGWLLTACNNTPEGQYCIHPGSVWAGHGTVLHCTKDNRWSR